MPVSARTAAAERELLRLCAGGPDVAALHAGLLRALRRVMPVDAAFFATADPGTLQFTSGFSEDPLRAAAPLFLDNELGGADVNRFPALATGPGHVASLDAATRRNRLASPRYRDLMRPLGLGDELRAAFVAGGDCWGYLCLHREDGELGFTGAEAGLLERIGPHVAVALRQAVLRASSPPAGADGAPGVVVLTDALQVLAVTPEAEDLLARVGDPARTAGGLPVAVLGVAAVLRTLERGTEGPLPLPAARVPLVTGGWLDLHASRLRGPAGAGPITVVVAPAGPAGTVPLLLAAHGLTAREAEVARLVLRGASTRVIAETLAISPHTVQDHLKAVFDKVGVRSRRELAGRLTGAAAPPSAP